jgi:hypothetical protein
MKKSDHDETKLPVWARDLLIGLRNQNRVLQEALDVAKFESPKHGATGKVMVLGTPHVALKDRAYIRFTLGSGGKLEMYLDEDGQLRVYADQTLYMLPRAANSVYFTTKPKITLSHPPAIEER